MKLEQTCGRCGGAVKVEDEERQHALDVLTAWEGGHRCIPQGKVDYRGRTGTGFASAAPATTPPEPWGHNRLDVRA